MSCRDCPCVLSALYLGNCFHQFIWFWKQNNLGNTSILLIFILILAHPSFLKYLLPHQFCSAVLHLLKCSVLSNLLRINRSVFVQYIACCFFLCQYWHFLQVQIDCKVHPFCRNVINIGIMTTEPVTGLPDLLMPLRTRCWISNIPGGFVKQARNEGVCETWMAKAFLTLHSASF